MPSFLRTAFLSLGLVLAPVRLVVAEVVSEEERARRHFDEALRLADRGETASALREFLRAYELHPHPVVLFNIGVAYSALGRPAEAASALRKYVAGAANDDGRRRNEAERLLRRNEAQLGRVVLEIWPREARVSIDGDPLTRSASPEPIELAAGRHTVLVTAPGYVPELRELLIEPQRSVRLEVKLRAENEKEPNGREWPAQVALSCPVPDATVAIDGAVQGRTPLRRPLLVAPGARRVTVCLSGYAPFEQRVGRAAGSYTQLACRLSPIPTAAAVRLRVQTHPEEAQVWIDGERARERTLPPGRHEVRMALDGFEPWTGLVRLADDPMTVFAQLAPTPSGARPNESELVASGSGPLSRLARAR